MDAFKRVSITFAIGFVAGVSPFLFMVLLPSLLNPGQHLTEPNYLAICITGLLIGVITTILFAKGFEERQPADVFFYALGIPAILVATVSNIGTKSQAAQQVTAAQVTASNVLLNATAPSIQTGAEPVPEPSPPPPRSRGPGVAWAAGEHNQRAVLVAQGAGYLVAIGRYARANDAWKAVEGLRQQRLRTELYMPKNLGVFKVGSMYCVTYTGPLSKEEAVRLYNLIRINDPQLSPEVLKTGN